MFDPFQHLSSQEFQTVTSFCCVALPVRWYWCKYVQRQEGALQNPAGVSEDETLQPLPSSSPEHSLVTLQLQARVECKDSHALTISSYASARFCNFRLTCFFSLFKFWSLKKVLPLLGSFFSHFPSGSTDTDYHWLEKAWRQQILFPLPWKWTGALLRVRQRQTSPNSPKTHF